MESQPVAGSSAEVRAVKEDAHVATSSASGQEELCCLLCDDDPIVLRTVGQLLKTCGYRVLESKSAKDALAHLEASKAPGGQKIDLVLTDILMPEVSGMDLMHEVMHGTLFSDVPVVLMSSEDSQESVLQAFEAGAADYLIKPVRRNEVATLWQHVWRANKFKAAHTHEAAGLAGKPDSLALPLLTGAAQKHDADFINALADRQLAAGLKGSPAAGPVQASEVLHSSECDTTTQDFDVATTTAGARLQADGSHHGAPRGATTPDAGDAAVTSVEGAADASAGPAAAAPAAAAHPHHPHHRHDVSVSSRLPVSMIGSMGTAASASPAGNAVSAIFSAGSAIASAASAAAAASQPTRPAAGRAVATAGAPAAGLPPSLAAELAAASQRAQLPPGAAPADDAAGSNELARAIERERQRQQEEDDAETAEAAGLLMGVAAAAAAEHDAALRAAAQHVAGPSGRGTRSSQHHHGTRSQQAGKNNSSPLQQSHRSAFSALTVILPRNAPTPPPQAQPAAADEDAAGNRTQPQRAAQPAGPPLSGSTDKLQRAAGSSGHLQQQDSATAAGSSGLTGHTSTTATTDTPTTTATPAGVPGSLGPDLPFPPSNPFLHPGALPMLPPSLMPLLAYSLAGVLPDGVLPPPMFMPPPPGLPLPAGLDPAAAAAPGLLDPALGPRTGPPPPPVNYPSVVLVAGRSDPNSTAAQHRRAAVQKYLEKKKNRNFTKKVRYESRKRLAEARPRVRGQFVKQDPSAAAASADAGAGPSASDAGVAAHTTAHTSGHKHQVDSSGKASPPPGAKRQHLSNSGAESGSGEDMGSDGEHE